MKIKRSEDKKKKELTEEEKELRDLKRAKNVGLAGAVAGGLLTSVPRAGNWYNNQPRQKKSRERSILENNPDLDLSISKGKLNALKWTGLGLAGTGLALHGISAVKYRKLKKKLDAQKKEEEELKDDNSKKEK